MAIQTYKGITAIPETPLQYSGSSNSASFNLSVANAKAALVFQAPKTGTISAVIWRCNTVTTACTIDVRLETVDTAANGDPTGTLFGTTTNAAVALTNANNNTFITTTLTLGASVTAGNLLALVIAQPAVSSGDMQVGIYNDQSCGFPFTDTFNGTAWTKQVASINALFQYSDGSVEPVPGNIPILAVSATFNSASSPNERGIKITPPFPCNVMGAWVWADFDGDCSVTLYDTDGVTALATTSVNRFARQNQNNNIHMVIFPATVTLSAASAYRLALKPTTTTNIIGNEVTAASAAAMDTFSLGQSCILTTRTGTGSWTETTTSRASMGLLVNGLSDGAGGAGGRGGKFLTPVTASYSGGD